MSDDLGFDVVIIGAGPAGLCSAIRLKQLSQEHGKDISVCVLEKGSEVGAHILSGAVLETRALDELLPQWRNMDIPIKVPVKNDQFYFLTEKKAWRLLTPPPMKNHNNFIISLGNVCRWLGKYAESLGVEIYSGFAASDVIIKNNTVKGVMTKCSGVDKMGQKTDRYEDGVAINARHVIFAEGCRGSLSKTLERQFNLRKNCSDQTYGIGIKELWEVPEENHDEGMVLHTIGWPLDSQTYGGSFLYHLDNRQISIGYVVGLDYKNPYLNPYEEFQRFKHHPLISKALKGGRRLSYGARALNEGGHQSVPQLSFPGGSLIGCAAGFLNVAKIKGTHTAMKSGMIAAEAIFDHLVLNKNIEKSYDLRLRESWVMQELHEVRNIRPSFRWGMFAALAYSALEVLFKGKMPWTLRHHTKDNESLIPKSHVPKIEYPKPDGVLSFDRLSSVFISGTNHEENQPSHLKLLDDDVPIDINLSIYDGPEQRYCPAGVYEIVHDKEGVAGLQINAQNCLHCKTCDIKDPSQNINWTTPEGGGGPNYPNM